MRTAYLGLYTLTDAQRAVEILAGDGIRARASRMPSGSGISCAFGIRLRAEDAREALRRLERSGVKHGKTVYRWDRGMEESDIL